MWWIPSTILDGWANYYFSNYHFLSCEKAWFQKNTAFSSHFYEFQRFGFSVYNLSHTSHKFYGIGTGIIHIVTAHVQRKKIVMARHIHWNLVKELC